MVALILTYSYDVQDKMIMSGLKSVALNKRQSDDTLPLSIAVSKRDKQRLLMFTYFYSGKSNHN